MNAVGPPPPTVGSRPTADGPAMAVNSQLSAVTRQQRTANSQLPTANQPPTANRPPTANCRPPIANELPTAQPPNRQLLTAGRGQSTLLQKKRVLPLQEIPDQKQTLAVFSLTRRASRCLGPPSRT